MKPSPVINSLLVCGIAVAVVQISGDMLAATLYPRYSYVNQTVSELSATGAPTQSFLRLVGLLYDVLVLAFALGVWKAAGPSRSMRTTAVLLVVFALNGIIWQFFPMRQLGGETGAADVGHIAVAIAQVLTMVLFMAFGSGADGRWFRIFSILVIAAVLAAGAAAAQQTAQVAQGLATPWIGLIERVSFYGPSLWIATLAAVLLRERRG